MYAFWETGFRIGLSSFEWHMEVRSLGYHMIDKNGGEIDLALALMALIAMGISDR